MVVAALVWLGLGSIFCCRFLWKGKDEGAADATIAGEKLRQRTGGRGAGVSEVTGNGDPWKNWPLLCSGQWGEKQHIIPVLNI